MAYRSNGPPLAPLQTPAGYDAVQRAPASPRFEPSYDDVRDIQDDPYAQNPNLPPQGRFYGHAMQNDYSRQSLAASEISLHHPQGGNMESPYTPYDSANPYRGGSSQQFAAYHDEPDSHQMAYLGDSRSYGNQGMEKSDVFATVASRGESSKKKRIVWMVIAGLIIVAIAAVCVYLFIIKPKSDDKKPASGGKKDDTTGGTKAQNFVTTGKDGSTVTTTDGKTFTYHNSFGGFWVFDPNNPFDDSAQAQSYSAPLNQPWKYGTDRIRG